MKRKSRGLFHFSTFPLFRFSAFPLFRFSAFPLFRFSAFPLFRFSAFPLPRCFSPPARRLRLVSSCLARCCRLLLMADPYAPGALAPQFDTRTMASMYVCRCGARQWRRCLLACLLIAPQLVLYVWRRHRGQRRQHVRALHPLSSRHHGWHPEAVDHPFVPFLWPVRRARAWSPPFTLY